MPMPRRSTATPCISTFPMWIEPAVGFSKPAIMRSVVVLPQPDGPSSETNSPGAIVRSSGPTACVTPKCLVRPVTEIEAMEKRSAHDFSIHPLEIFVRVLVHLLVIKRLDLGGVGSGDAQARQVPHQRRGL